MSQPIDVRAGAATAVDAVLEASVVAASPASGLRSAGASSTGWIRRRWRAAPWSSPAPRQASGWQPPAHCRDGGRTWYSWAATPPAPSRPGEPYGRAVSTGGRIDVELADLGDLEQVRRLGERLLERLDRLDVLINNAGALLRNYTRAPDGHELTITVHLLAQFALTQGLLPLLEASAPSRVITMTSGGMYTQKFSLGTLVMSEDDYDGTVAYARAKRAQVVLTHELQRRFGPKGVDFHVGAPRLGRHAGRAQRAAHVHQGRRPAVSDP